MITVLITGASRGIGRAVAKRIAQDCDVLFLVARDTEKLNALKKEIVEETNCAVHVITADLEDVSSSKHLASSVAEIANHLDLVFLNAGIYEEGDAVDGVSNELLTQMRMNLYSVMDNATALLSLVEKSKLRRIVITGSTAGFEPYPGGAHYGITKWALRGYAQNLRRELMPRRIGVTYLASGATDTDMWAGEDLPDGKLMPPSDHAELLATLLRLSPGTDVEEIVLRPILGDPH